jgi:hypothetical protein
MSRQKAKTELSCFIAANHRMHADTKRGAACFSGHGRFSEALATTSLRLVPVMQSLASGKQ